MSDYRNPADRPGFLVPKFFVTVQTGCSEVTETGADIIFIEKRRSFC